MRRYRGGKTQEGGVGMQQAMQDEATTPAGGKTHEKTGGYQQEQVKTPALRPVRIPLQRSPCVLDVWACLETPRWRVTDGSSQGCSGASATHPL
ncbi:hypothetical protein QR685DRAFT_427708, partial [Neurospora intermedia]